MDENTPLEEVILHLPTATAKYLDELDDPILQEAVLKSVRAFVAALEERTQLDPFQYEVVLDVFTVTSAAQIKMIGDFVRELVRLQADLHSEEAP